jgi:predicted nuclease of predicted toxin-antitoxin system
MKILLDECVPKSLKPHLSVDGHECSTVPEAGFSGKTNGELLRLAEGAFDVFLTLDKGLQYQQNLAGRKIAILFVRAKSSRVADILPHIPACLVALRSIKPGQIIQISEKQ